MSDAASLEPLDARASLPAVEYAARCPETRGAAYGFSTATAPPPATATAGVRKGGCAPPVPGALGLVAPITAAHQLRAAVPAFEGSGSALLARWTNHSVLSFSKARLAPNARGHTLERARAMPPARLRQTLWNEVDSGKRRASVSAAIGGETLQAGGRSGDARHVGAERLELLLDALVTAVEVINPIDDALAFGGEGGEHQRRAGPENRSPSPSRRRAARGRRSQPRAPGARYALPSARALRRA